MKRKSTTNPKVQPSQFHSWHSHGKDPRWSWDGTHPDLIPTSYFEVDHDEYCSYCCEKMMPLQAGLRESRGYLSYNDERDYSRTGYTCFCKSAIKEMEYKRKILTLMQKHQEQMSELHERFDKFLQPDKAGRLEREYQVKKKRIEGNWSIYEWDEQDEEFEKSKDEFGLTKNDKLHMKRV